MDILKELKSKTKDKKVLKYTNILGEDIEYGFRWNEPAKISEIKNFEIKIGFELPQEYKEFLSISNGAQIYTSLDPYEDYGYKLLSLNEMMNMTNTMKSYGYQLKESWIVFMELLFSPDVLIFNLDKVETNKYIIDGDTGYPVVEWESLNGGFKDFICRLFICNGSMYWRW